MFLMQMENKEIINALNALDLSSYPYDEVKLLVGKFAPKNLRIWIPKGHRIERIRPDANVFEREGISYRPAIYNTKPQRASLPGKTAFYGTLCHLADSTLNTRYISLVEVSSLYRKGPQENGRETYTWSRWVVTDDIHLVVIVDDNVFASVQHNPLLEMARQEWQKSKTFIDGALQYEEYNAYVVSQFSKLVTNDYEYIVSATVAEKLMYASKADGVMYPSVQAGGDYGMNVALRPDVADNKLKLTDVSEMEYVRENGKGNLRFTKHGIPVDMDVHGIKRWKYDE